MKYFFILGQSPKLSLAEIPAALDRAEIDFKIEKFSNTILIVETKSEIDGEKILDSLGGTIKIGKILNDYPIKEINSETVISNLKFSTDSKFHFGFSIYRLTENQFQLPQNFGLEVKRILKEKNISSRLVTSRSSNLSSVTVAKNRLLKNGAEMCFIVDGDTIRLGQTLAVQKFGEYSKFDYDRPGRDSHSGMLPPKVGKMMLNLSRTLDLESQILDPFCGSGTTLMQAALLEYKNLLGSDTSERAIKDTRKNFEFLITSFPSFEEPELYVLDARNLSSEIKAESISAIVTEPFMGPPLKGSETDSEIENIINDISSLYIDSFTEFKKILKLGGKVVMVFPILQGTPSINDQQLEEIEELGFSPAWELPEELKDSLSERKSITYSRAGQMVEREIFVFQLEK